MGPILRVRSARGAAQRCRPVLASLLAVVCLAGLAWPLSLHAGSAQPAQAPPRASEQDAFLAAAYRALAEGRADEAQAQAEARGSGDPLAAAVLGRIAAARGDHAEAERLLAPAASADPAGEAALELGLLFQLTGRADEARRALRAVVEGADRLRSPLGLVRAGRAARALGLYRDANAFFRAAAGVAPRDPVVNTAWGELFLEKYNRADAVRSFRLVLEDHPDWTPAHLGLAQALVEENPTEARLALERALTIDPGSVAAHVFHAEVLLDEGHRDEARAALARALELNGSSLQARSLVAALAYLEDRTQDFEAEAAGVLAINPGYGEVYRVAGDLAARHYRFEEAVALVRKAIALDPDNMRAHADLGIHLLRTGDEEEARQVLELAFSRDPYDVVTYNLLGLLDTLENFQTVNDGDLIVRFHRDEAAVLREYALPLAHQALGELSARYGFRPEGPILIEIFPRHDDFAVRNVGLPGMVGALGACFGRVVTLDSPRARPPGTFNWQATLWHELAHVITLQLSKQRVPRWLTEGISVFEEKRARPEWGRDGELAFAQALERGEVLALRDLNAGFTRIETIGLAYFQASLLVEHLQSTYGEQTLPRLLAAFGEGLDTDEALARVIGVDLDGLQSAFDAAVQKRFGALGDALGRPDGLAAARELAALERLAEAHPGSYPAQVAYGRAAYEAGEWQDARQALERAAELVPMATGSDSPRALLADIAVKQGDPPRAIRELTALLAHDHTDVEAARRLATLADEVGDAEALRLAYERVVALDPFDAGAHATLGRLALTGGDLEIAQREFRAALAAGPVDPVAAHCDLAESYLAAGRLGDAKTQAMAALEIAPTYERAQELLLRTVEGRE